MTLAASARIAVLLLPILAGAAEAAADLHWTDGSGFRTLTVQPASSARAGFTLMPPGETGLAFTNALEGDLYLTNAVAHNGAGAAIGDVDGDGWPDVYLCNLQGPNRLFRNLGNWRFAEINPGPAACADQLSTGATFADVDGDRDLDLLVNGIAAGTRLFLNGGTGDWTEAAGSGLSRTNSATSLALADIDGDGDLDLYCAHYIDVMHLADPTVRFAMGRRGEKWEVVRVNGESTRAPRWKDRFEVLPDGSVRELPEVHGLYRNDGKGHFTAIQHESGVFLNEQGSAIPPSRDWGLAAMFRDINGDLAPDLYVCNDNASPDRFWMNTGKGTFRAIDRLKLRHTSRSSMGLDFADVDRDGNDDLFVLDMLARDPRKRMVQLARDLPDSQAREQIDAQPRYNRNTLFLGRPDGSFAEAALMAGVAATDWSWCPVFLDVDLDGFEDLLVSNGFSFDVMDQDSQDQLRHQKLSEAQLKRSRQLRPRWPTPNAIFRNRRDGTFEPMDGWGFNRKGISYGMALGDLDNDGDLDVVVNNLNEAASVFRNDASAGRIAVRLKGASANSQGIGARIRLTGGAVAQSQEMICGGRYMSGDQAVRVFAADAPSGKPLRLEVTWRNGNRSVVTNVQANRIYEIDQPSGSGAISSASSARPGPYFVDASSLIDHAHAQIPFDDWARQPLLPRRLSRLGPGVSWFDVNADGWEDLIIAGGSGASVFANEQGKRFRRLANLRHDRANSGAALGWHDGHGDRSLLLTVSDFAAVSGDGSKVLQFLRTNVAASGASSATAQLPVGTASAGPMALADIDGDGDLDLFVGGRFQAGRYPEPVSSTIWLNEAGELRRSDSLSKAFELVGMVNGATFCDLDNDGDADLALAIEWGPIRVFRNQAGHFEDITAQCGLAGTTGWWNSITAGDFDGDGRMDLAAGNWGRNSLYELHRPGPLRIYYGDWNSDGTAEVIEAWRSGTSWLPIRDRSWMARGFPELPQVFSTHGAYAMATVQDILGARHAQAKAVEATQFESCVFLNRGSQFERVELPREAQLSPVFAVNTGDFDGDGLEDLFLGQNFFGAASDISRDDGGRGLWLRGAGNGAFSAVDASVTGITIYGEQRGAALADFNHDGRVDLAVTQNNSDTKLYMNQHARRGLRVTLAGLPGNPDAVGARMRVRYAGGRTGPCRTIQAGSGYWSQDGAVQVLGLAEAPVSLWVRWPGGKEQNIPIEQGELDVRLRFENEGK